MNTYISLLRGINIAGQKKILMKDLKQMYDDLGFTDSTTYIQSGNVIFQSSETDVQKLSQIVKTQILDTFWFDVAVLTITPHLLKEVVKNNPFIEEKFYITYLFDTPKEIPNDKIIEKKASTEKVHIYKNIVYFCCPEWYDKTKLSNNFFEKIFWMSATTRNLNTTKKLLELSLNTL